MINPYAEIGELLRNAREEQRFSLMEAAEILHIHRRYLMALEDGDIHLLPGSAYVKGYLKRYAVFLHLDIVEVMRRLELSEKEARAPRLFLPHSFSETRQTTPALALGALCLAVIVIVLRLNISGAHHNEVALIEPLPIMSRMWPEAVVKPEQNPCLSRYERLYPPCYMREDYIYALPLSSHKRTVMELYK